MRILKAFGLAALIGLLAGLAQAGDSALRQLATGDDGRLFRAVGRLEMGGKGFCTATLIEPRLVLTAAHCVVRDDGRRIAPADLAFRAGLRDGRAEAHRTARRVAVAAGYKPGATAPADLASDIALIELDRPVDPSLVAPIAPAGRAGSVIGVVSYAKGRESRPSLQEECSVLGRERGVLVMSCEADFGTSGAPVMAFDGGKPRIVSVVSAMADADGRKVSLGADLVSELPDLRAELARGDGVFFRSAEARRAGGPGKFLRP